MRDIKFRFRIKIEDKIMYSFLELESLLKSNILENPRVEILSRDEYIGSNDINNNEIYENDILLTDEAGWTAKVIFSGGAFWLTGLDNKGFSIEPNWNKCKIIGTIICEVKDELREKKNG